MTRISLAAVLAAILVTAVVLPAAAAGPSFDCRSDRKLADRLVCGDAGLARLDVAMAGAFQAALKRLDPATAALLREDQRAYLKNTDQGVEYRLGDADPEPGGRRGGADNDSFGRRGAIAAMTERLGTRIDFLRRLAPRHGFDGRYENEAGHIAIRRDGDGYAVEAFTTLFGWTRYWCSASGRGRIDGDGLTVDLDASDGADPTGWQLRITRAGAGLRIEERPPAGTSEAPRPPYCPRTDGFEGRGFLPVAGGG